MITIRQVQQMLMDQLTEVGAEHPRREAIWMMEAATGLSHAQLIARDDRAMDEDVRADLQRMIDRRRKGEPLQYVLGCTYFFGLPVQVDRRVHNPRHATGLLVARPPPLVAQ